MLYLRMTDSPESVILPILKDLQKELKMVKDAVLRIDGRLAAGDNYMAGFHRATVNMQDEIDMLRGRVEALEERPDA